jgi:O-antigen/teichoic acid export membrane protein
MRTEFAIKNIVLQTTALAVGVVLYFICTPYFVDSLGVEVYGVNQLLLQTIGYFGLAELGVGISLSVLLYKEIVQDHRENINALLSAAQRVYMFVGLSVFIVGGIFSFFISDIFSLNASVSTEAQIAFMFYVTSATASYFASVPAILMTTAQKGYKNYVYQLLKPILTYMGYVVLIYYGYSIIGIAFISLSVTVWSLYGFNRNAKKEFPWLNIWSKQKNYAILNTSKYVFIEKMLIVVLFQTDIILITYFLGVEHVAGYSIYAVFFFYIKEMMLIGTNNLTNGAGEMYQKNEIENIVLLWKDALSIVFFASSQLCVAIFFLFPHFFKLWINPELLLDTDILFFCVINLFYILTVHVTTAIVGSKNIYKERMKGSLVEVILNIGFSCFLIPRYGILGAVVGTTIGHYCVNAWFIPYLFLKSVQQSMWLYLTILVHYSLIVGALVFASWFFYEEVLFVYFNQLSSWTYLLLSCLAFGLFLFVVTSLLFYLLDPNFKKAYIRILFFVQLISNKNN